MKPNEYFEIQPGDTLRAVIPLSHSGVLNSLENAPTLTEQGNTLTLAAPREFAGFETDFYRASARKGGGVTIAFLRAEATRDGKTSAQAQPALPLFDMPPSATHVRLLYLVRESESDHNMAIVAARGLAKLDALTAAIRNNQTACVSKGADYCAWVPQGVALRPEHPQPTSSR